MDFVHNEAQSLFVKRNHREGHSRLVLLELPLKIGSEGIFCVENVLAAADLELADDYV
jgi:hypothetical protein